MKSYYLPFILALTLSQYIIAQDQGFGVPAILQNKSECLSENERNRILQILADYRTIHTARSHSSIKLEWPVRQSMNYDEKEVIGISNYVDWNEAYPNTLTDYNCGTRSYDTEGGYNHKGTDVFSWPFTWHKMDNDHVEIIAAAAGEIIYKEGNQDDKSCSFNSNSWNAVYIQHDDGSVAWYGHLKTGSLTEKNVGERVDVGEYLGVMGSSGNSTGPHLHLEIYDANGNLIDPFAGTCNDSVSESWWVNQPDYYMSGISRVLTHDEAPVFGCYGEEEPNIRVDFTHGERVYFATYFRDQMADGVSTHVVYKPDGSVFQQWNTVSPQFYAGSYWYRSFLLPTVGDEGQWRFTSSYEGDEVTFYFYLISNASDNIDFSEDFLLVKDYEIGEMIEGSFEIINSGNNGVIVTDIRYPNEFKGHWDGIIDAQQSKAIDFTFTPKSIEPLEDAITVITTRGSFKLDVFAEAPILGLAPEKEPVFYPNPVRDGHINFLKPIDGAEVISLSGKILLNIREKVNQIDVSHLPKGIYLLKLNDEAQESIERLIIDRTE
ncbi:peptidoglycan DD-metalloendopeptidase family protein [Ekhidna sp.]|uniref:peptidoglycan DD-metalloendopeptidase family protein n=1 Tax=Ekhidna sp. TaxID=2608089 RepID=UPI003CCB795E